jgi:hypothetical protein
MEKNKNSNFDKMGWKKKYIVHKCVIFCLIKTDQTLIWNHLKIIIVLNRKKKILQFI